MTMCCCLPPLWFVPLSFQRTSARTRTRRDGREDDEDEDLTACSAGRPSEDACEKPMLRKKTTLEMAMAERRRRLKEEERKGEVRFPASSRDDDDDDDVREKDDDDDEGDNDSSVLARIRSVQSSSYGVEVSYTGDEMISKEREREEKEDEGDEEEKQEKQEKQERSKKEELRSEILLRKLREDGVLDSIERSTTEYWKE